MSYITQSTKENLFPYLKQCKNQARQHLVGYAIPFKTVKSFLI